MADAREYNRGISAKVLIIPHSIYSVYTHDIARANDAQIAATIARRRGTNTGA